MFHPNKKLYEFDEFRLDVAERTLWRRGVRVPLAEKAFETLCALVKRGNHLVGKDELMMEVWAGAIVEENNLDKKHFVFAKGLRRASGQSEIYRNGPRTRLQICCRDP
jgi:DNA-binding winged helix-turn-helix (wHTH) protein